MKHLYEGVGIKMKKIAAVIAAIILIYSIYVDVTVGILPSSSAQSMTFEKEIDKKRIESVSVDPFILVEIKPGDTVLSILETIQQGPLPVPIAQIVTDFEDLNGGVKPEQIQTGKSYKFPDYQS